MAISWRTVKLGDICRFKYGEMPKKTDLSDEGYPVFSGYRLVGRSTRYHYRESEIIVVARGVGGTGDIKMAPPFCFLTNLSIAILIETPDIYKPFLYYRLASTTLWELRTGSAQAQITIEHLKNYEVAFPPLPVQQRIAGILSAYDELIENSQRRINILESMARALYREWFVHFRFPGHENHPRVASPLGEIPLGWEVKSVKDVLARRAAGSVYRDADVKPEGDVPVVDQSTNAILGFHDNAPDHNASSALPIAIFGDHTCKMQLLIEPFSVGPNVVPFVASQEMPTAYVFYAVNSLVHTQEYKRHWMPLTAKEVVVADRVIAQRFASLIQPMLVTQETHRKAIQNLRRTRDLLLPRLLSGQIEVEAA